METQEVAKIFRIRAAMPATWTAEKQGKLCDLTPVHHNTYPDLLVARGQAEEGMKRMYGVEYLPIFMADTRSAQLVMMWAESKGITKKKIRVPCSEAGAERRRNRMYTTTQDHENVDLKPATVKLVHDKSLGLICSLVSNECLCLYCLGYIPARLHPGLTKNRRPRLLAEKLHAHQDKVRAYSPADAQTQSLLCLRCANCNPSTD